jgi:hypothetical protein
VIEQVLEGGDVSAVVRVGDTVRRPMGAWSCFVDFFPWLEENRRELERWL